jgi:hypothetical protein
MTLVLSTTVYICLLCEPTHVLYVKRAGIQVAVRGNPVVFVPAFSYM